MTYKLKVFSIWEFGQRKDSQGNPHQEDCLFPAFGKQSDSDRLFILCDGMGGHDAGEVASATVCEAMSKYILNEGCDKGDIFTIVDLYNAIETAFEDLDKKDSGSEKKMGTTMAFLKLHSKGATIAHIGDSRVYHIRAGKTGKDTQIVYQTEDHSLVNDLIKIGEITKEDARFSKQKNVITRAMQPNMEHRPKADVYETSDIKAGDYFYLCSDGMLEQVEMENGVSLKNIFSDEGGSDEKKVEILKSVTEKNRDNHSAFIIHILEVENSIAEEITQNTSDSNVCDKFAAIIEDDSIKSDSQTQTETIGQDPVKTTAKLSSNLNISVSNKDSNRATLQSNSNTQKKEENTTTLRILCNKFLSTNIIHFIVAAIVVFAFVIGFNFYKFCTKYKSINLKETKVDLIDTHPSSDVITNKQPQNTINVKSKTETSTQSIKTTEEITNSAKPSKSSESDDKSINLQQDTIDISTYHHNEEIVNSEK